MMRDTVELSQFSEYRNYNQTISAQFRRIRESYNFSIGVDAFPQTTILNYKYMGKEYPVASMNTNELLWNASISHSFLQGKALTIKAEVFDILH